MSRIISIVFLLLASTILLAHDAIPHQHHDHHVCFEHQSCQPADQEESQNDENSACCPLAELVFFTPGNASHEVVCPFFFHDTRWNKEYCCQLHGKHNLLPIVFSLLPFRQNPHTDIYFPLPVSYTFSLRAPPVA
jgi:hypothetical protein